RIRPRGSTAARLAGGCAERHSARRRAGAVHGSAGAIGVEAEPAAGDTGRSRHRFDRTADGKLNRGTKPPLRVSNATKGRRLVSAFLANQQSVPDVKTTRCP